MANKPAIWTDKLIDEIDKSVRMVIARRFPEISFPDREDVRQDVRMKIWKILESGKKIDRLESYLWKVAVTTTLAVLGNRIKDVSLDEMTETPNRRLPSEFSVDSGMEEAEAKAVLASLIAKLPLKRRLVMKCSLEGMDLEEISARLGWSLPKVRHLYYRGRKELRKHYSAITLKKDEYRQGRQNVRKRSDFTLSDSGDSSEVIPE